MNYKVLVVLFSICLQGMIYGQSNYQNTTKYIEVNGTNEQYTNAIEQLQGLLQQQYQTKNISASQWDEIKNLKKEYLKDIKNRLVPAYESYFTEKEIDEMYEFYQTDAGKQMAVNRNALTKKQLKIVREFYETPTGLKIQNNSEALRKTIEEISTEWSHLLYVEAKNILE